MGEIIWRQGRAKQIGGKACICFSRNVDRQTRMSWRQRSWGPSPFFGAFFDAREVLVLEPKSLFPYFGVGLPRPSSPLASRPLSRQRLKYQAVKSLTTRKLFPDGLYLKTWPVKMSDKTMNWFWESKMSQMCQMNGGDGNLDTDSV